MSNNDKNLFTKIAEFITITNSEKNELRQKIASVQKMELLYSNAILKIAKSLSRTGFLQDDEEKEDFVKRAKENPEVLWKTFQQVSEAADVSVMGKTASLATVRKEVNDPIMIRAGLAQNASSFLDTI